jgi:hypothetical protein
MSIKRIIRFLNRYLLKHPVYVVVYVATYFLKDFSFKEHFFTEQEVAQFIRKGKSIIRFGDGEINLMLDLKNHYHQFSPRVKNMMEEIVRSYRKDSPYVLSVPKFINFTNESLKGIGKFNVWLPLKVVFTLFFYKGVGYMDAHNFYYDGYFEKVVAPEIQGKKIIYITRKETIEAQGRNKNIPWNVFGSVETPEKDALSSYDRIKTSLDSILLGIPKEEVVLLVGMGPVGKYFIFEYAQKGVQGIDVGVAIETIFTEKSLEYLI